MSRLRVIAGELGGRRLVAPKGARTRPTADRVKEALFASLGDRVTGASVLDGFAGSGALAIEALSRGAAGALLVDRSPAAVSAVRANLAALGLTGRATVRRGELGTLLASGPVPGEPYDLVLLDPPYDLPAAELDGVLEALAGARKLAPGAAVVLERAATPAPPPLPSGWDVSWQRTYGGTLVVVAAH